MESTHSSMQLWWADPAAGRAYCESLLTGSDVARAAQRRGVRAQVEWQASRALMQAAPAAIDARSRSVSHRAGHALLAVGGKGTTVGVDLEAMQPRQIEALAPWCCSADEMRWLDNVDGVARLTRFYLLWTLKEAFIKAAQLDFPADMRRVGLSPLDGDTCALRPPGSGVWEAYSYHLDGTGPGWIAGVVWQAPGVRDAPQWHAGPFSTLPAHTCIGQWRMAAP
jgi:4'-phosphopantetheinyl transferase